MRPTTGSHPPRQITQAQVEARHEWIAALRSGDYKQTTGKLKSKEDDDGEHGYCCLGVACDKAPMGEWFTADDSGPVNYRAPQLDASVYGPVGTALPEVTGATEEQAAVLPLAVAQHYGMNSQSPTLQVLIGSTGTQGLTTANDGGQATFDQIADALEADLERCEIIG